MICYILIVFNFSLLFTLEGLGSSGVNLFFTYLHKYNRYPHKYIKKGKCLLYYI